MIKLLIVSFLLFSWSALISQTESVEVILNSNGDMVEAHSKDQVRTRWAETLIRGTSKPYYPFVDSLYVKYFYRVLRTKATFRDTVLPQGMNFRQHQESSPNIVRAFDLPKLSIEKNLTQAWNDILSTSIIDSARNDEIEDVLEWERWEFGSRERKEFICMRYDGLTKAEIDSYLTEIDTIIVIPGQAEPDTTRRIPRLGMTITFLRDSIIVIGKSFNTLTLRDLSQSGLISQKLKTWFQNNVVGRGGITLNTTIWELLKNHRGKISYLWMRHPKFKQAIKRKWLKKR